MLVLFVGGILVLKQIFGSTNGYFPKVSTSFVIVKHCLKK